MNRNVSNGQGGCRSYIICFVSNQTFLALPVVKWLVHGCS